VGYILPLTHYQYEDYQKRVIKNKQDRFHIDKLFKVMLAPEREAKEQHMMQRQTGKTAIGKAQAKKVYANITGKGTRFNESI